MLQLAAWILPRQKLFSVVAPPWEVVAAIEAAQAGVVPVALLASEMPWGSCPRSRQIESNRPFLGFLITRKIGRAHV